MSTKSGEWLIIFSHYWLLRISIFEEFSIFNHCKTVNIYFLNDLRLILLALEVLIVGNALILKFDFYLVTQSRGEIKRRWVVIGTIKLYK